MKYLQKYTWLKLTAMGLKPEAIIVTGPPGLKSIYPQKIFISRKKRSIGWQESLRCVCLTHNYLVKVVIGSPHLRGNTEA
jgi:hypothetical protein